MTNTKPRICRCPVCLRIAAHKRQRDFDSAIGCYEKALALDPSNCQIKYGLAYALLGFTLGVKFLPVYHNPATQSH